MAAKTKACSYLPLDIDTRWLAVVRRHGGLSLKLRRQVGGRDAQRHRRDGIEGARGNVSISLRDGHRSSSECPRLGAERSALPCCRHIDHPQGNEERRLHVKMVSGESLRIRATNLCLAKLHSCEPSKSRMSDQGLAMMAGRAIRARGSEDGTVCSRDDFVLGQVGRYDLLASLDEQQALPSPVRCCHWNVMGCCDALPEKENMIAQSWTRLAPTCYGDGLVHLKRLGEGIVSCGDLTCSICLDAIASGEFVSSLPCGHQFHEECITPALEATKMKCPNCRFEIKGDPDAQFNAYTQPALRRIVTRFCEFIDSGMCERCQMAVIEKQQYGKVTLPDGRTVVTIGGKATSAIVYGVG